MICRRPFPRLLLRTSTPLVVTIASAFMASQSLAEQKLSFNRDIRPILSDKCFQCHGPDASKQKGDLRLDIKENAYKGGKSGSAAIVPGKPEASEVIERITTTDADDHMPPEKSGKTLTPAQTELLRRWIKEGAEYQGHWAFSKPERAPIPVVLGVPPGTNPIDAFVCARLAQEGLQYSQPADKATLLRRVSLDLTGIPPTSEELDRFLADSSPHAYETVVDRLLASPQYGERMAIQWLDFARYADSNGFQTDSSRNMWEWRDWVINAFNKNEPFDQFTIEQLAGDLLPNPTTDQLIATGFNRNVRLNGEGGRIIPEWFAETVIDRVETTGNTWLALTVGCCRCHDHKFDPISQKEFYQLFAFFNSNEESGVLDREGSNSKPTLPVPTPEQTAKLADIDRQLASAKTEAEALEKKADADQVLWEKSAPATAEATWSIIRPESLQSKNGAQLTLEADGSIFSSGPQPETDEYVLTATASGPVAVTGIKLELLPDDRLPSHGPGRATNGNPIISEFRVSVVHQGQPDQEVKLTTPEADFNQKDWESPKAIDGKLETGWAVYPEVGKEHNAVFPVAKPFTLVQGAKLKIIIDQNFGSKALLGKFRISITSSTGVDVPSDVRKILASNAQQRKPEQKKRLTDYFRARIPELNTSTAKLDGLVKSRAEVEKSFPTTMIMRESPKPREAHILIRGQYDKPGDIVERGVPASLPPLPPGAPVNRLGLAEWLVSKDQPLTARVWVNRAWEKFFGIGIVKTSENFGSQADWPSHPELLDWLACEFMQPTTGIRINGQPAKAWDMKALQKLIVMSAAYRQSANTTPALIEKDPDNRLLARGPRFRLSAELLRDEALAVSGLLVEKIGGPSVHPYMPRGVWDETSVYGDLRNYQTAKDDGLYRRTLYTIWKRTAAPPTSLIFDAPGREICSVKRSRTNTPLQALSLLNEVTFVEAARKLAERMITEGGTADCDRIQWGFRRVTGRKADAAEMAVLTKGLEARLTHFHDEPAAAAKLIAQGESKPPANLQPDVLAAYTVTANVLMNLDEFITR